MNFRLLILLYALIQFSCATTRKPITKDHTKSSQIIDTTSYKDSILNAVNSISSDEKNRLMKKHTKLISTHELYKKIENYYLENPCSAEWVKHIHKNALGYDTINSELIYIHWDNYFLLCGIDSSNLITGGLLSTDQYYFVRSNRTTKTKIKAADLPHTIFPQLDYFPTFNFKKLEQAFGTIKSFNSVKDYYQLVTSKYLLKVDTLTYRINSLHCYTMFEGKIQYDEYKFIPLTDSQENSFLQQAKDLADASKKFSVTTFKEEEKTRIPVSSHEGKTFAFNNLVSFNVGPLDSLLKGKYVILDFFYQTCYPCHQMTKWIVDWIPSVDTSKIMLIGVDAFDKEKSMQLFVKYEGITYPIIIEKQANDIISYYGISGYPTLFLLSPDGKIKTVHEGMSKHFLTNAEKIVKQQSL